MNKTETNMQAFSLSLILLCSGILTICAADTPGPPSREALDVIEEACAAFVATNPMTHAEADSFTAVRRNWQMHLLLERMNAESPGPDVARLLEIAQQVQAHVEESQVTLWELHATMAAPEMNFDATEKRKPTTQESMAMLAAISPILYDAVFTYVAMTHHSEELGKVPFVPSDLP